jgi:hypothetical protein
MLLLKAIFLICLVLAVAIVIAIVYGASRWHVGTKVLRAQLRATRVPITPATYDPGELEGLPPPVQHYFHAVLTEGQPIAATVRVAHAGQFNMDATYTKWRAFTSDQLVITRRPGFDWDARMRMAPGLHVFVHDAYVAGEGLLHAALCGLITLADLRGTPEVAEGELMRFLAEAAWYPTALLPSQGIRWDAIDDTSARASRVDGATTVSLVFRFDAEGLIHTAHAEARYRTVNGALVATPWQGRFWAHEVRGGMRIPLHGKWRGCFRMAHRPTGVGALRISSMSLHDE